MNMVISMSIRNMTEVPANMADVPSIIAAANLSSHVNLIVVCPATRTSQRSITPMVTSAGMNDIRMSTNMSWPPEMRRESITSHR